MVASLTPTQCYLFARLINGLSSAAIFIFFGRVLAASQYVAPAIALTTATFSDAVAVQWLRQTWFRFAETPGDGTRWLSRRFLWAAGGGAVAAGAAVSWLYPPGGFAFSAAVAVLGLSISYSELGLSLLNRRNLFRPYLGAILVKVGVWMAVAVGMVAMGARELAPVVSLAAGAGASALTTAWMLGAYPRGDAGQETPLAEVLRYGRPLFLGYLVSAVLTATDRMVIYRSLPPETAGVLGFWADAVQLFVGAVMSAVCAAALPGILRRHDAGGSGSQVEMRREMSVHLRRTARMGALVALFGVVGVPLAVPHFLGGGDVARITGYASCIAMAQYLFGLRFYAVEPVFQVTRKPRFPVMVGVIVAPIYVGSALMVVGRWGGTGVACASALANGIAVSLLAFEARRRLGWPEGSALKRDLLFPVVGLSTCLALLQTAVSW